MFLIVDNMLNQQQNQDILNLCERAGLDHVRSHLKERLKVFFLDIT